MPNSDRLEQHNFLYSRSCYRGEFTPEALVFNANLQEFAQRISYISGLHTNGKLSSEQAYEKVECLWTQLEQSKLSMASATVRKKK